MVHRQCVVLPDYSLEVTLKGVDWNSGSTTMWLQVYVYGTIFSPLL